MIDFYSFIHVLQSLSISLGLGFSTATTVLFLTAQGQYDETRKNIMHTMYTLLRVAMISILVTTLYLSVTLYLHMGSHYFDTYTLSLWTFLLLLFLNSFLMTTRIIPKKLGPAVQVTTWYALAVSTTLPTSIIVGIPFLLLLFVYAVCVAFVAYLLHKLAVRM